MFNRQELNARSNTVLILSFVMLVTGFVIGRIAVNWLIGILIVIVFVLILHVLIAKAFDHAEKVLNNQERRET